MPSPTVAEVLTALGRQAPWDKAADWDPVGLQFGDPAAVAYTAAVTHEVTEEVVARLVADPPDLVVSYHPLLFSPTTRLVAGRSASGRAWRLITAGVALAVPHTAFDVAPGGVADALADALGLEATTGFGPLWPGDGSKLVTFVPEEDADTVTAALAAAGAGTIGNYTSCSFRVDGTGTFHPGAGADPVTGLVGELNRQPEVRIEMSVPAGKVDAAVAALLGVHPYEEPPYDLAPRRGDAGCIGRVGALPAATTLAGLAEAVKAGLGGVVRVAGEGTTVLRRVAVVPGSGSDFIDAAAAAGAEVLVTGDVSHHRARRALDRGMAVIDPGHVAGERPGVARLYAAVLGIVPGAIDLTGGASPWNEPSGGGDRRTGEDGVR
jgi:dinuclear metal center YbgI/SA1388 family protein